MEDKIDEILENFHLGKIDLIEVRKQLLILYGVMLPKGTLCVCDNFNNCKFKKDDNTGS